MKKIKLTALERSWILYDIGNSAFILLVSTLIPIYFNALATTGGLNESLYLSYWGYAGSVSTLLVAVIGPICGTLADHRGFKKPIFMVCMLLGVLGCAAMGVTAGWLAFLVVFVLAKVGYSSSLVFYDAMLPEVTTDERMDTVSSMGYAYGYIGSVIPFILCLLLVLFGGKIGIGTGTAMVVSFLITAVWWFVCTQPLLKRYRQTAFVEHGGNPVLLTLPPIDAHRYFNWFTQGENVENILQWLGDIDRIYRWHEMYNLAVCRVAMQEGVLLLDISSRFLERSHYEELLCEDGIHPNEKGHELIFESLREAARKAPERADALRTPKLALA